MISSNCVLLARNAFKVKLSNWLQPDHTIELLKIDYVGKIVSDSLVPLKLRKEPKLSINCSLVSPYYR